MRTFVRILQSAAVRLRPAVVSCCVPVFCYLAAAQTRDENWARCKGDDADLAIGACAALIQSGKETTAGLSGAFVNRGQALDSQGEHDRAVQDYDQAIRMGDEAIRLNPNDENAFHNRGLAYSNKGDYDRAIQDLDQAVRLNPNSAGTLVTRAAAYGRKGDYNRSIQDADQAIRLDPQGPPAGQGRVARGGNFADHSSLIRASVRYSPGRWDAPEVWGFRCAGSLASLEY